MICNICPRRCGAERTETYGGGFCRMPAVPVIARAGLHLWEEPVLSGTRAAERCSSPAAHWAASTARTTPSPPRGVGKAVTTERLREIFRELIAQGAHNIDLITASHFVPFLLPALEEPLPVPVVFNCGGYERVETLRLLEGKVQIWLPDLKYGLEEPARRYSHAPDYFPVATEAIREMFRQVGPCRMEDGLLAAGGGHPASGAAGTAGKHPAGHRLGGPDLPSGGGAVLPHEPVYPQPGAEGPLRRHVTAAEYRAAAEYMENCGIVDGFVQERTSARESIPRPST